jgi:hypothetical protein
MLPGSTSTTRTARVATPRSPLPRSLRRAAARRGAPSPMVREAAAAGVLTRGNTRPGSAGRRAVDRATYLRRRAAEPDLTAREALGHRVAGSRTRTATFFISTPAPRRITVAGEAVTLRDVQRAGRYMGGVGALLAQLALAAGRPAEVARIKRSWEARMRRRAPIAGHPVLADADAAILLADELRNEGDAGLVFDSGRSRPGRRRRSTRRAR